MALYTDTHVGIRNIKAASSWMHDVLIGQGGAKDFGAPQHAPAWFIRENFPEHNSKVFFAALRNPWDWYASLFVHDQRAHARPVTKAAFKKFLRRMTHHAEYKPQVNNFNPAAVSIAWKASGKKSSPERGLYTAVLDYCSRDVDLFLAADRISEGLAEIMGEPVQGQFAKPRNTQSTVESYEELYDDEMIEWVGAADEEVIRTYGFDPFHPSPFTVAQNQTFKSLTSEVHLEHEGGEIEVSM